MFPVRKELVGKRFAFIRSDGRSGTRFRGSGGVQNIDSFIWITGTIVSSNVEAVDVINQSAITKKVKVCLRISSVVF